MVRTRLNTSTNPDSGAKMENPKKGKVPAMKKRESAKVYLRQRGIHAKRKDENPGEEIPAAKKMKIGEVGDSQAAETVVPMVVEGESSTPVVGGSSTVPETVVEESTSVVPPVVPPVVEREKESEEEEENEPEKEAAESPEEVEGERSGGEATASGSTEATRSEDQSERPSDEGNEVSKKLSGKTGRTRE